MRRAHSRAAAAAGDPSTATATFLVDAACDIKSKAYDAGYGYDHIPRDVADPAIALLKP